MRCSALAGSTTTVTSPYASVMSSAAFSVSKNISYDSPEQPPGRTATRRKSSGWSSASRSSLTLVVAVSVSVIIVGLTWLKSRASGSLGRDGDPARIAVVQRCELFDCSPADGFGHPFGDPAVQVAHQLRVRLGELAERAVE